MLRRKTGRPRGGKHTEDVREYWREAKGYKDRDKDFVDRLNESISLDPSIKKLRRR